MDVLTRKLHDQAAEIEKRMAELETAATTTEEGSVEAKQIAEEQATLAEQAAAVGEQLEARNALNTKIAKMRTGVNACQPMGLVTRSEQPADAIDIESLPFLRSFPRETARAAGMMLRSLARGEITEIRAATPSTHPIGVNTTLEPDSHGEKSPTYNGRNAELVAVDFYRTVMGMFSEQSVAMNLCNRITTTTNRVTIPRSDEDVEAALYLENCEILPVEMKTSGMTINVEKIGARAQISNELMADAIISMAQFVAQKFANAFAKKVDKLWLEGDAGAGITGLLTAATQSVDISGKNLTAVNVAQMVAKLHPYASNPVWVLSQAGLAQVMQAAASAMGKDVTQPIGLTLFGMPIYRCLSLPAGTLGVFGDFRQATTIVDRSNGLTIAASRERAIEYDQTVFVGTQRIGIANNGPAFAVKLLGAAPTVPTP